MKQINNFVDNIHNDAYKEAYRFPKLDAQGLVISGGRTELSLDGDWNFTVDQYDNCLRAKWFLNQEYNEEGRRVPLDYAFDDWETVPVPGVFNLAKPEYFYYEGPAVYSRRFFSDITGDGHVFLNFGAVYYEARIFLNGTFLGVHRGGSTPFSVEVTGHLKKENHLVVVADNTRKPEQIPSVNTDWFSYGGIFRSVTLLWVPKVYIKEAEAWLEDREKRLVRVKIRISEPISTTAQVRIPELGVDEPVSVENGTGELAFCVPELELWEPGAPKLYDVKFFCGNDSFCDRIGFRTIETAGGEIMLNGKPLFLKGVCLHEDSEAHGRAVSKEEILQALHEAKKLGCNFLRLAHYPHTPLISRLADEEGLLLWEEIPVYWWIDFENPDTYEDARNQLEEMMRRDANRASVIIWSVGNENPDTAARYRFMSRLADFARSFDPTRLISAACLVDTVNLKIEDPLEQHLDVIGVNEYYGWYDPDYKKLLKILERSAPKKPVVISEFGADGAACVYEEGKVRGSEVEQALIYEKQTELFRMTSYIKGLSPWILYDYRTPKRLGAYQQGYNIKGLVTADRKHEKLAFDVMKRFYSEITEKQEENRDERPENPTD